MFMTKEESQCLGYVLKALTRALGNDVEMEKTVFKSDVGDAQRHKV